MKSEEITDIKAELELAGYSLTDEEIQQIIEAFGAVIDCVKQIVKAIVNALAPAVEQVSKILSELSTEEQKTSYTQFVKEQEVMKAKSYSLNLDKRPKIHFCRNNC